MVDDSESGWRLDLFLAHHFPKYSRTNIRNAIVAGAVTVDPDTANVTHGKPSFRLVSGQTVVFTLPDVQREAVQPEEIPLDVLYDDSDIVVINKPAGMVVHPSRGHWSGTLVSALAFRFGSNLSLERGPERPGIVHRLDRDTSGVIVVAKNDFAHRKLAELFHEHHIRKEYFAIVVGEPALDRDLINAPIGQHPRNREKMMIAPNDPDAKEAVTFFEVIERYNGFAAIRCLPQTGRTHQIRVHLQHTGYPILCDRLYAHRAAITREELLGERMNVTPENPSGGTVLLSRQALHARRLTFEHPTTGKEIEVAAPLPDDMQTVVDVMQERKGRVG
jgi:23S rRNA pseudouridine1911/1915/1917 synthase